MNKDKDLMLLNIQLFAEEADNDSDEELDEDIQLDDVEIADDEEEVIDEEPIDKTKAFANRLKEKTSEIEKKPMQTVIDEKNKIARLKGYTDWDAYELAIQNDQIMELGVDDPSQLKSIIDDIVSKNPEVVKAKQILQEQAEKEQQKALENELDVIKGYNNTIKTLDDLVNLPNYQQIYDKVSQGYKLSDAYLICNLNTINIDKINKARQDAEINATSKNHMKNAGGGPGKNVVVPQEVYNIYRQNFPKWTDQQIRDNYNKQMNK